MQGEISTEYKNFSKALDYLITKEISPEKTLPLVVTYNT